MHGTIGPLRRRYRAIWISDVHLGTRGCKAEFLLDFLNSTEAPLLYLVGDIFDGWRLKRSWYWPESHNAVVQAVLRKARKGTRVVYVPGNHDEFLRDYIGLHFCDIEVMEKAVHAGLDGKRYLVLHGDQFDGVVKYAKWLALLGDWAYNLMIAANNVFNLIRRRLGFGYWSLSAYLKNTVKNAVQFIDNYEKAVAEEARRHDVDGVICGHIHKAELRPIGAINYCNDGDWVESCTALVEHLDGRMEILKWAEERAVSMFEAA
ncbi:UDP-2,3-diacylglucosamine diphosphatase [Ferruginivarius sediminum]|uniref:UDP-2,3-diacylglucosamine diphosphatase n=1 Tax=Ferruginivarius sediminum TaxID=2661937 RepID=A0A369TH36_9PROT|nr:UDP-2,3-diacylglucosamine diphosphatase [Ferruginivarius sediminum]RDD62226.1 UDP-2,3-diacylglucosamine diphosphatase [Ferruginivarius sediminum]